MTGGPPRRDPGWEGARDRKRRCPGKVEPMHASGMALLAAAQGGAQVVPARAQMATTLGFHIILACFGIALPTIVLVAEYLGLRHADETAMKLARRWSQVLGVLVAVGAVTGTVLSFEMG